MRPCSAMIAELPGREAPPITAALPPIAEKPALAARLHCRRSGSRQCASKEARNTKTTSSHRIASSGRGRRRLVDLDPHPLSAQCGLFSLLRSATARPHADAARQPSRGRCSAIADSAPRFLAWRLLEGWPHRRSRLATTYRSAAQGTASRLSSTDCDLSLQ